MTTVDELIAFVRQQLDEEAEDAQALADLFAAGGAWVARGIEVLGVAVTESSAHARHITRWDPARVLAEVEAKRRILDLWSSSDATAEFPNFDGGHATALEDVIGIMAQPYAGQPGWREEWHAEQP